jgi:hypothetical protein
MRTLPCGLAHEFIPSVGVEGMYAANAENYRKIAQSAWSRLVRRSTYPARETRNPIIRRRIGNTDLH